MLQYSKDTSSTELIDPEEQIKNSKPPSSRQPSDFYDILHSLVETYIPELHAQVTINFMVDNRAQTNIVITARVTRKLNDMIILPLQ